jgi:hypothetical protein
MISLLSKTSLCLGVEISLKIRQNKSLAQSYKAAKGAKKYKEKDEDERTIKPERAEATEKI